MNLITYRFTLDLAKHGSQTVLSGFKVGDTNRAIDVSLSMNGEPYYLGADQAAQLRAKYIGENEVVKQTYACTIANNRIFCKIDPALLTATGELHLDLEVGDLDSEIFSTASFLIFVKGTVSNDEEIPSDDYTSVITALANSENALKNSISTAEVEENGNLVFTLHDGKMLDCGNVIGPQGPKGERGEKGDKGEKGDVDHTALAEVRRYKYDYDCNGVVDINDAIFLLYHIQNSEKYPIPSWCNGDFNGDGVVNEDDAEDMMYAVNAPSQHPHLYDTDARTADYSIVANSLKGAVSGEAVSMKDVSPLEHSIVVELKSDTITDFSSVTLKKCGKNLLDLTSLIGKSVTANGGTLSCGADGGISGSGTLSGYVGFDAFRLYLPKGKYILSASGTFSNFGCYLTFRDKNNVNLGDGTVNRPGGDFVFNTENYPSYSYVDVTIKRNNDTALSGIAYFQIELGSGKATEYEPFKEPETYNGTVKSVPSLYPTTTLFTDTAGVIITAEYNKDLNKAFAEIYQAIATMGASAVAIPEEV